MTKEGQDRQAERRISEYVEFLKRCYSTDENGIADLAGVPRDTWERNRRAHFDQMEPSFIVKTAALTGISLAWLIAEAEGVE